MIIHGTMIEIGKRMLKGRFSLPLLIGYGMQGGDWLSNQHQFENLIKETSSPCCPGVHLDRNFETVRPFFGQGPETSTNPCSEFYIGFGSQILAHIDLKLRE